MQDEQCKFNKSLVAATVSSQVNITEVRIELFNFIQCDDYYYKTQCRKMKI